MADGQVRARHPAKGFTASCRPRPRKSRRLEGSESHPEGWSPRDPGYNPRHHGEHYLQPRVAELVGLVSGEHLGWFSESCGPLPDLGAAAARIHGLTKLGVLGILGV